MTKPYYDSPLAETTKNPRNKNLSFRGSWADRLEGVFAPPLHYRDARVLDLGCNIGIIAYEIAKRGPSFYHGIELSEGMVLMAHRIFEGVPIESRFDWGDLGGAEGREKIRDRYDICLYLATRQHVQRQSGEEATRVLDHLVLDRCRTIVFRGTDIGEFESLALAHGRRRIWTEKSGAGLAELAVFS